MTAARPVLVGIAGGSASGKTSIARRLQEEVGAPHSVLLELDAYYKSLGHLPLSERKKVNFDHPNAFDWDLLSDHVEALLAGRTVDVPVYDYALYDRTGATAVVSRPVILIEGILVFWHRALRERMDIKVFVDTAADLRLVRRLRRDTMERGRSVATVLDQYESSVRLMHEEFCEPTKVWADVIIPRGGRNHVAVDMVRTRLLSLLHPEERARATPSRGQPTLGSPPGSAAADAAEA